MASPTPDLIAEFKSRHGDAKAEFQLYADRSKMKFQQQAAHLNDRSTISGEQVFQLNELKPEPVIGTIRVRRMGLVLFACYIAIGATMGTSRFQSSHGHSDAAYLTFGCGMILLIITLICSILFAWKNVKFRGYSFRTGANAFSVIQGNRRDEEFTQFCDQLEAAIAAAGD